MGLSEKHLKNYCQQYQGHNQCRYLDQIDYTNCACLKLTGRKDAIDEQVKKYFEKMKANGQDPELNGSPCGNGGSCNGYPYLKIVKQGYDVP